MSTTIESLELKITSDSKSAIAGITALTQSLEKLKNATKGGLGLSSVTKEVGSLNKAVQSLSNNMNKWASSQTNAAKSSVHLGVKLAATYLAFKKIGKTIMGLVTKSTEYIENVNLFNVSMGQYAGEATTYAKTVSEVMGIDTSDWMRAQGVFMTIATGFGVAGDRAAVMSKNLTQLGYDISSFYNISVQDAMDKLKSGLAGELEPLRAIGYDLSQAKLEATALELGIEKSVSSMTQAEKAQLRYYAIMTQVTQVQGDMARTLEDPANQLRVFKAQVSMAGREIGNIFIPALNAILPYAIAVTKVIRNLAASLASLVGFEMPEVDYSGVDSMSNSASDTSDALSEATEKAKDLKSHMLGFDELNIINPNNTADSTEDVLSGFDFELPQYDFIGDAISTKVNEIVEKIEKSLDEITLVVSGFALAIGAVLAFSGVSVGRGIALMAIGATALAANLALNWSSLENPLETALGTIGGMVGGALLATGAILAFSGANIPLGIALMAGGAVALTTAVALNWESLSEPVRQTIGTLEAIVGGALLTLGAILAFSGVNIPMGIALMAVGALSLASAVVLNWDSLTGDLESTINTLTTIVSGALLGVGAVLAFTGANIPLGVALMAAGAVTMGSAIVMKTEALSDEVKGVIAVIDTAVSGASLAVGAILAFSGANIPLGIALMASGAFLFASAIVPNWDKLSDKVKSIITTIELAMGGALLALGTILAFSGANIPLGIGLMATGALSLGAAIALDWNAVVTALQGTVGAVTAIISGALLVVGAILAFSGASIPLGISLMALGASGLATTAALNWDSIVEAIQGPVGKIMAIAGANALVIGLILLLTGVGIPLGLGLILGGAASLGTAIAFNWDSIVNAVKEVWKKITDFWDEHIAPVFTAEWWKNLGISVINGFISGIEGGINGIIGAFESMMNFVVNGINKISIDVPEWLGGGTVGFNLSPVSFDRVSIPRFAEGGFPAQGQMFIAREAGAEMVGNIGRRTAVVNNEQIVESISVGVADANSEQNVLLREQNSLLRALLEKDIGVYLDGRALSDSVDKHKREQGREIIVGGVL